MTQPSAESWSDDLASLPFEEVYRRLEDTVSRLEQGELTLTESERLYMQGMDLAQRCQQLLTETELRITQAGTPPDSGIRAGEASSDSDGDWAPPAPEPDDPSVFDDDLPF